MPKIPNWDKKDDRIWENKDWDAERWARITVNKSYSNIKKNDYWEVGLKTVDLNTEETFSGNPYPIKKFTTQEAAIDYARKWMKNTPSMKGVSANQERVDDYNRSKEFTLN